MATFDYTVTSDKSVKQATADVEAASAANGFRVLHTHDVAATLAEKGFQREPLRIVEVCNAKYASQVLQKDVKTALMLPCPICVYSSRGQTYISTMLPTVMTQFYPSANLEPIATEVELAVCRIVDNAR